MNASTHEHKNGDRPASTMHADELEFIQTLPVGQWLLGKLEESKKLSTIIHLNEVRSPFLRVVGIGPDFKSDIEPGDRVTYAECLRLPKEMENVAWAKNYMWVHENKVLGRLPRNDNEKKLRPSLSPLVDEPRHISKLAKGVLTGELDVSNVNINDQG